MKIALFWILALVIGVTLLMAGVHNIDNGHNLASINYAFNTQICDQAIIGCLSPTEAILSGLSMIVLSIPIIVAGCFGIGYYMGESHAKRTD